MVVTFVDVENVRNKLRKCQDPNTLS